MRKLLRVLLLCLLCALPGAVYAGEAALPPDYPVPDYVRWLLDIARAELGYTEDAQGRTKYGEWAGDPSAEWCAEFLCWCVDQVDKQHGTRLLQNVYPLYSGQNTGLRWFLRQGRYIARTGRVEGWGSQWFKGEDEAIPSGGYIPQPGDWVFYTYSSTGDTSHVAMVEYCTRDDSGDVTAHVIEGNLPDRVQRAQHALDDWRVLGYGTVRDLADIVLQGGNEGQKVLALQEELRYLGYLDAQYVTGIYGPSTTEAVKAVQAQYGLTATGIANRQTQLTLDALYRAQYMLDPENWLVVDD